MEVVNNSWLLNAWRCTSWGKTRMELLELEGHPFFFTAVQGVCEGVLGGPWKRV